MTCDEMKPLFAEYWSATLSDEQRASVEQHLTGCQACRAETDRLGSMWRDLALLPADEPGPAVRERFYETLSAYRDGAASRENGRAAQPHATSWQTPWRIAAGIALLLSGAGIGFSLRTSQASAIEVAQLRGEIGSMRQLVTLSLLQQQSASERLRGVSWAYRAEPSDTEVLSALLSAVNHDSNVNVRLAAVDALRTFSANRDARDAALQALPSQTAPIVQVALIDLLVELKETGAGPELRRVASDSTTDAGVRQRAQWALERLQ